MTHSPSVRLKAGKDKPIRNRHHWIFSGAIADFPSTFTEGEFLSVYSADDQLLGSAYFNRKSSLIGRMVSFDATPPLIAIRQRLEAAIALRKQLFKDQRTTAYRLLNGEGDGIPGLVIDCYGDVCILQIATLGMERLRSWIVDQLVELLHPQAIYEKSHLPTRKEEGLPPSQGSLYGPEIANVEIMENGLRFQVDLIHGQKTGFFLDQREMRHWVQELSAHRRVLNCFCYTGAFSVYAAAGKARQVDSVDISEDVLKLARQNMQINSFSETTCNFYAADVFQFLRERALDYELVILDPPAFAKRQKDVISACRGYKDINRIALQKMPAHSLLLTCSCSYHVDAALFQKVLFQAAVEAKRTVRIIGTHRMAPDHPINICHPEGNYLKSFLLYIE